MARRGLVGRTLAWFGRWLLIALVVFVAGSVLAVVALRYVPPVTTPFMLAARIEAVAAGEPFTLRYDWEPITAIAPSAALAVVASEDQLFPVHRGFDVKSIQRAMEDNERGGRVRGASTISQQVAKNLFLWSGRSWVRKGLEAWFTVLIELVWPKRRILETYLNVAEFGRGLYGVPSAARTIFRKEPAQLTPAEAALLAAVLPNPIRLRADRPSAYVQRRGRDIEAQMRALGPRYLDPVLAPPSSNTSRAEGGVTRVRPGSYRLSPGSPGTPEVS